MRTSWVLFLAALCVVVQPFVGAPAYAEEPVSTPSVLPSLEPPSSPEPLATPSSIVLPSESPSPTPIIEKEEDDESLYKNLPEIEAKTYEVRASKVSKSNRVYVFDDLEKREPRLGRIILVRKGDQPVKAFRVLKLYPERNQFAVKRVRVYGGHDKPLELQTNYIVVEKIADLQEEALPPPPLTDDEKKDIQEIEEDLPPPPDEETLAKMKKKHASAEDRKSVV